VVLGVVQVEALAALRPNSVRLELWSGIVLGLLGLLSVVLSLAGADDAAGTVAAVASLLEVTAVLVLSFGTLVVKWKSADGDGRGSARVDAPGDHAAPQVNILHHREVAAVTKIDSNNARATSVVMKEQLMLLRHY
ncbi:membrane-associated protein, putative, partial [Bodo saltans]